MAMSSRSTWAIRAFRVASARQTDLPTPGRRSFLRQSQQQHTMHEQQQQRLFAITSIAHLHTSRLSLAPPKVQMFDDDLKLVPPSPSVNYFHLFELDETFDVDARALSKKFKALQKQLHPDKFAQKSSEQKDRSELWSSHVNNAYNRLLKPLERALYLLELKGAPLQEGDVATDANFLAEIMEVNEEVVEAESSADLSGISQHNKAVLADYKEKVSKAFAAEDINEARTLVTRMKYYSNIQDKIKERELELKMEDM